MNDDPSLFDGSGDKEGNAKDQRLKSQVVRVYEAMLDGGWMTLDQIAALAKAPAQSVSARLRDLRKRRFGGFTIEMKLLGDGVYTYRLLRDSGEPKFVYRPRTSPRSEKGQAKARIRRWLEANEAQGNHDPIIRITKGQPLYVNDIIEAIK